MRRQPSITCSQLSRSRNKWRDWTAAAARMRKSPGPASSAPIASAISRSTLAASSTIARSTMTLARKSISTRRAELEGELRFPDAAWSGERQEPRLLQVGRQFRQQSVPADQRHDPRRKHAGPFR